MDYIKFFSIAGFFIFSALSCSQCSKQNQYRQNALDISGSYQTTADSDLSMDFIIENEDNKKYNILITLNRKSQLIEEEKTLLNNSGFSSQTAQKRFAESFVLGSGFESDRIRGENYSEDKGATSQFFVCSPEPEIQQDSKGGLLEARYCISGLFQGESREISGELTLNLVHNSLQQKTDGSFVSTDKGKVQLKYKAQSIH